LLEYLDGQKALHQVQVSAGANWVMSQEWLDECLKVCPYTGLVHPPVIAGLSVLVRGDGGFPRLEFWEEQQEPGS